LSNSDRDRVYRSSRLLFFPSKQEGFGVASAEAASFGVPVLGLAGTVVEELFPNGTGAIFARDLAKHSIAEAAIPVLADSRLASSLGRAAWNRVQNNFLEEHFAQRFRRILSSLIPLYDMANQTGQMKTKPDSQEGAVNSLAV
jgi:glycosyltransferase involved in cell wall biosynthesis